MRRYVIAAFAAAACIFGLAGTASAATATARPAAALGQVATHYSQTLAGHAGEGNGAAIYNDIRGTFTAPSEPICDPAGQDVATETCTDNTGVMPGQVATGGVLAQNVSIGGWEDGLALVFDDVNGCPGDQWTVEYGFGHYDFSGPVLKVTELHPVEYFGGPICIAAGSSEWLEMYQVRTDPKLIDFFAGPTQSDENVAAQIHVPFKLYFQTFAAGVNTTNGNNAANLNTGTLADFASFNLTQVQDNFHKNGRMRSLSQVNYDQFIGTMTGSAPSVANPQTLTPGSVAVNGGFLVTVP